MIFRFSSNLAVHMCHELTFNRNSFLPQDVFWRMPQKSELQPPILTIPSKCYLQKADAQEKYPKARAGSRLIGVVYSRGLDCSNIGTILQ